MSRKIFLVGGNSGVGKEIYKRQTEDGDEVIRASREPGSLEAEDQSSWQVFDALNEEPSLDLPEILDGFVYCPGSISLKPFARLSDSDFLRDLEVNYLGCARALRQALPSLKRAEKASIVMFSTVAVQTGLPFHASIAGAKGAIEGFARSLAAELSPSIRVNCLALSLTDTPMAESLLNSDAKRSASAERHPLKRIGNPDEVAEAVRFFLSEESGFITGQVLQIDGGLSSLKLL